LGAAPVNDAVRLSTDGLLTNAELAARPDFTLGLAAISPSSRTIAGPGGMTDVEPRVMQVLVVLADAGGQVVTRGTLFDRCWGGVYVGDDSLNRTIGAIRKLAADIAGGSFEIETIPRTGYRLVGDAVDLVKEASNANDGEAGVAPRLTRRVAIAGGGAAALLAGGGLWLATRQTADPRFTALMARGDEAFRNGTALDGAPVIDEHGTSMMGLYQQAVRVQPDSARAWGLLAYFTALAANEAEPAASARLVAQSQTAIRRALDIDPTEPNARVGLFLLQGPMLDWMGRDRQLRGILATDPNNLPAMTELMPLLQAAGLTRESWSWNERILRASPFARGFLAVKAMKLWILGNVPASDKVIDGVRGLWPMDDFGFLVRMMLFTLTGRPRAALAMIDTAPPNMVPDPPFWRAAAQALDTHSPKAVEAARRVCFETSRNTPWLTNQAVMILCALGLKDDAFELTNGFVLWRGKAVSGRAANDYSRRMTQWLFTPPVALMRADPRFKALCDDFGLTAYWRARHIRPDYQVYG
jgi:DNA-binding winged helix-turn-helix (wHTH) protein